MNINLKGARRWRKDETYAPSTDRTDSTDRRTEDRTRPTRRRTDRRLTTDRRTRPDLNYGRTGRPDRRTGRPDRGLTDDDRWTDAINGRQKKKYEIEAQQKT
ncbi:hypothetical protein BV898_18032 [Hypsibius exemplaris]|uniref:Uncharacterized protein n=1 Tax=Hypsibius exemplaris TaxID=2072580 RepID=A0A9X6NJ19_HYPEX|nr:hypothetical protein BV898_18032 [Hypsibius exemplaris]